MSVKAAERSDTHSVDPLVRALTPEKIRNDIKRFVALLDSKEGEGKVHDFLASHSYFFNGILRLTTGYSRLYSKIRLGSDYEIDFVWFDTGSLGPEWYLAEIEQPRFTIFNAREDPSAALTHGIRQIRDWQTWIDDNRTYANKLMPRIKYPLGLLFIGRRKELVSIKAQEKLHRIAYEKRMFLRVHTLDWFASAAESVESMLGDSRWWVPMKASSHKDLSNGLPETSLRWFESAFARHALRYKQKERLMMRKYEYRDYERELHDG